MKDWQWKIDVKYDPDQPRIPAGDPRGGQWTNLNDIPQEGNYRKLDGNTRTWKNVEYDGRNYAIDLDPESPSGHRPMFAKITWWEDRPTSGPLARAISELTGKPSFRREYFVPDDEEIRDVVAALGWKFSQSKIWRDTWEFYVGHRLRELRRVLE